jgi:acyl-coenzyme A thioesterase PaaI-like protein
MTHPADIPAAESALPPSYGRVSLGVVMSAREADLLGNIHGGEIVKLADSTSGAVARAEIRRAHRLARKEEIEAARSRS